jgi:hypothetical protein
MKNFKVFIMVAMGLIAGAGLVLLVIRYMDKLIELFESIKKNGFLKLEIGCPHSAKISQAAAEDYYEAFQANYAAEPGPDGEPQPNTPTEE